MRSCLTQTLSVAASLYCRPRGYTRTVDVAAVRDLYGTIVNEGANRGILVTTASYGPDAYEFAKNKPISLVDGPNLIAILKRHGRAFRIDLDEARRLNVQ